MGAVDAVAPQTDDRDEEQDRRSSLTGAKVGDDQPGPGAQPIKDDASADTSEGKDGKKKKKKKKKEDHEGKNGESAPASPEKNDDVSSDGSEPNTDDGSGTPVKKADKKKSKGKKEK